MIRPPFFSFYLCPEMAFWRAAAASASSSPSGSEGAHELVLGELQEVRRLDPERGA